MSLAVPLVILLSVTAYGLQDSLKECFLEKFTLTDKEDKIIAHFEQLISQQTLIPYECLELLLSKGFYKTALTIYETHFLLNNIDVSAKLTNFLKTDPSVANVNQVQQMFKHAIQYSSSVFTVTPVYQWAQSRNHTLINVKFSHRVDSPACINAKIEKLNITETNLHLEALGIVSHQLIRYAVDINFYRPIDPKLSTYQTEAVGTMFFNLTKLNSNDLWLRLKIEEEKTPIWWDLRDNIGKDMEDFVELLEESSLKKEKKADKLYRKKQKERQKEKERQDKLHQIELQRQWNYEHNQTYIINQRCENGWYQRQ